MVPAHERTLEIAVQYTGDFYASSFDHDAIRTVREIDPSVDIAPIFGGNVQGNVEVTRELDAELATARRAFSSIRWRFFPYRDGFRTTTSRVTVV